MNLAFGVAFLWLGATLVHLASRDLGESTPWGVYMATIDKLRGA